MSMQHCFEVTDRVSETIKPEVQAMVKASGLNEFDAAISVLFSMTTYLDLEQYPILVFQGARATGKSAAERDLTKYYKLTSVGML
ncbi:hypothetical protein ACFLTP_04065 [Chloroflexota bacterium]